MVKLLHRRKLFKILVFLVLVVAVFLALEWRLSDETGSPPRQAVFNKSQHSISDPSSLWVVVNKGRVLPASYVPEGLRAPNVPLRLGVTNPEMFLRPDAAAALEELFAAASKEKLPLMLASAYRSFAQQASLYNLYVKRDGKAKADASSARPGHSEHQLGLAADVEPISRECEVETCFSDLPEGKWVAANAHKYGFIISYQKGKEHLTGYEYEPWHLHYVGKELAAQLYSSNQTIEQFFGLEAAPSYPAKIFELKN